MKSHYARHSRSDEENPYWLSFSDLMAGLLVIFILAAMALILELTQTRDRVNVAIDEVKAAELARWWILREIQSELKDQGIYVDIVENNSVLRIPERALAFDNNEYELPRNPEMIASVGRIGRALHRAITKDDRAKKYLDTIFIEGHTDSRPTSRIKGNWGLSTFRAISLWDYWNGTIAMEPRFEDMKNSSGGSLFSVSGYAATRRINRSEITEADFQQNRRIDIRVTIKRPTVLELEEIQRIGQ